MISRSPERSAWLVRSLLVWRYEAAEHTLNGRPIDYGFAILGEPLEILAQYYFVTSSIGSTFRLMPPKESVSRIHASPLR